MGSSESMFLAGIFVGKMVCYSSHSFDWDPYINYQTGDLPTTDPLPYTPLATTSWHRLAPHIRLYYVAKSGHLLELSKARKWRQPGFDFRSSTKMEEDVSLTAVQKNDGQQIRTYSLLPGRKLRQRAFSRTSGHLTTKDIVLGECVGSLKKEGLMV